MEMTGIKRNIEQKLVTLLGIFPIVAILGARQTGKTSLVRQLFPDWQYVDLERQANFNQVSYDTGFFLSQYPSRVIFDEAQRLPALFSELRVAVDQNRATKGRYIITGSSSPELLQHISESLAGRIAIIELGTLKANEFYQKPLSAFYEIFQNPLHKDSLPTGKPPLSIKQMQTIWLQGGYPEPLLSQNHLIYQQWMENYFKTYIERDIAALFPRLSKLSYQRFVQMLGRLSGTILNKRDIARNIERSEGTIHEYLKIADGTFIWRQLMSYEKNIIKSVVKMPKGYIRDSGLLHYLIGITTEQQLYQHPQVGQSFEGFIIEELIKGLQATMLTNLHYSYYRTRNGAEIDVILEGSFGLLPIEIKHGANVNMRQLISLENFIAEHKLPFGILLNQSEEIRWLRPTIVQIPIGWL